MNRINTQSDGPSPDYFRRLAVVMSDDHFRRLGMPTYTELVEALRLLLSTAATTQAHQGERAAEALLTRFSPDEVPQAEQRVTPGGGLPGDHNGTKQAAQVAECKKPFFAWDGDNGRQDFATQAEALAYAQETIGYYRRDAHADGVWPDEVEGVIVGVVTHACVREGSEEDGFDYRLAPAQEAAEVIKNGREPQRLAPASSAPLSSMLRMKTETAFGTSGLPMDIKSQAASYIRSVPSESRLTLTSVSYPDLMTLCRLLGGEVPTIPEEQHSGTFTFEITMPVPGASTPWRPIDTAPKNGRTVLLGYRNRAGKWRTVRGQWMSADYIAEHWEDPDSGEPGWFETSEEAEDVPNCWPINPTSWAPLPGEPGAEPAASTAHEPMSREAASEIFMAWSFGLMDDEALRIISEVERKCAERWGIALAEPEQDQEAAL